AGRLAAVAWWPALRDRQRQRHRDPGQPPGAAPCSQWPRGPSPGVLQWGRVSVRPMGGWRAMAELPLSRPPEAAAAGRDVLLTTKLHLPPTRPGFVSRRPLAGRLAHTRGGELMLVCAPAGFGKTALVADWAQRDPRPVA